MIFVDTSALYSALDATDANHEVAKTILERLIRSGEVLLTTNYVLLETSALVQRRLGLDALRLFHTDIAPVLSVEWIAQAAHNAATEAVLTANRRNLSLVDCVSFHVMRSAAISQAFSFDSHFREQGFEILP